MMTVQVSIFILSAALLLLTAIVRASLSRIERRQLKLAKAVRVVAMRLGSPSSFTPSEMQTIECMLLNEWRGLL